MRQLSLFGTRKEAARPAPRPGVSRLASRRVLKWAAIALTGGGIVAAAIWVVQPGTLKGVGDGIRAGFVSATADAGMTVQRIHTEGQNQSSPDAIHAAVSIDFGTPIFDVDLAAARDRIQAIGWVESVTVERHLPSTIHVRIVERTPVALWQRNQRLVMVDRAGAEIAAESVSSVCPFADHRGRRCARPHANPARCDGDRPGAVGACAGGHLDRRAALDAPFRQRP